MVIEVDDKVLHSIKINLYNRKDTLCMIDSACVLDHDFTLVTGPLTIVANQLLESVRAIDKLLGINDFSNGETDYE